MTDGPGQADGAGARSGDRALATICVAISLVGLVYVLDVTYWFDIFVFREQFFATLYALVFAGGFLMLPASTRSRAAGPRWYDYALAAAGLGVGAYLAVGWPDIVRTAGILSTERMVMATIAVALILELGRRAFGWPLVLLAGVFLLYALYNHLIPGPFGGRGTSWARLSSYVVTDTSAILGLVSSVVFGLVFAFLLFGRTLFLIGGGAFFTDISMALMGHRRGGPAKVAVVASGLFGSLSGSASGNVVVTGSITIPMMVRTGYRPAVAGAVEAVSSSGGGLMPPIMGATAFIMAEFLQVPYRDVVVAALVPALLYYFAVFIQVDLEAARGGLKGLERAALPSIRATLARGWMFLVPLAALIYCLFVLFLSPAKAAIVALALALGVSFLGPVKATGAKVIECLRETGRAMIELGIIAAIAGIVLGVVNLTGLGLLFSQQVLALSGGNLALLLALTALASIVLGMSMPVTASYVILSVLAVPALSDVGIPALAAHLFVFYFAILSFITPPVCVAVFVAASIAKSKPLATAGHAMKMAVVAYVVPFVFVLDQSLLLDGAAWRVAVEIAAALIGLAALSVALAGHFRLPLAPPARLLIGAAGLACLVPVLPVKLAGVLGCLLAWAVLRRPAALRAGPGAE